MIHRLAKIMSAPRGATGGCFLTGSATLIMARKASRFRLLSVSAVNPAAFAWLFGAMAVCYALQRCDECRSRNYVLMSIGTNHVDEWGEAGAEVPMRPLGAWTDASRPRLRTDLNEQRCVKGGILFVPSPIRRMLPSVA